ncbi:MAG TPA: RNA 2',3'-cyclic phosphodiesterase [Alphaproteobacteria bacterium]
MIRLFVGIGLPEDIRARLAGMCAGVPGARWVPPENLHLTLRFIGEVPEAEMEDIHHALSTVRTRQFDISLAGVGHFDTGDQVRTLWVRVEKSQELSALQARVESSLVRIGLEPEERRFIPHITLARLRDTPVSRVSAFLAQNNMFRAGPIPIDSFSLFSSYRKPEGAIYQEEAEYPLTRAAA